MKRIQLPIPCFYERVFSYFSYLELHDFTSFKPNLNFSGGGPVHTREPINPRSGKNRRIGNERALVGESVCWSKIQRGWSGPLWEVVVSGISFSTGWKMVGADPALHRSYVDNGTAWWSAVQRRLVIFWSGLVGDLAIFQPYLDWRIWPKNDNTCKGLWVLHSWSIFNRDISNFNRDISISNRDISITKIEISLILIEISLILIEISLILIEISLFLIEISLFK